jgi:Protein of unknown function (DUF2612)
MNETTIQEFDYSVDLLKALLWQYNEAPNLEGILEAKQTWYDDNQTAFWSNWFADVFNLATANDFGCVVWAIILGMPLTLFTPVQPIVYPPFGFDHFNVTNFDGASNFTGATTAPISFTTADKRLLLQLRYRQMTSRATIPQINQILADFIVPIYGPCWAIDGDMSITIFCAFSIPSNLQIILTLFDVIPRGAGVALNLIASPFVGSLFETGDNGTFTASGTVVVSGTLAETGSKGTLVAAGTVV